MNVSLTTLAKFLLANPEHLHRIRAKIQHVPVLVQRFDALSLQAESAEWSQWLELAGREVPSLLPVLLQDLQEAVGEETSLSMDRAPEPTNVGLLLPPPPLTSLPSTPMSSTSAFSSVLATPLPKTPTPLPNVPTPLPNVPTPLPNMSVPSSPMEPVPTPLPKSISSMPPPPPLTPSARPTSPATLSWIASPSTTNLEAPLFGGDDAGESTMMEDSVVPPVMTIPQTDLKPVSSSSNLSPFLPPKQDSSEFLPLPKPPVPSAQPALWPQVSPLMTTMASETSVDDVLADFHRSQSSMPSGSDSHISEVPSPPSQKSMLHHRDSSVAESAAEATSTAHSTPTEQIAQSKPSQQPEQLDQSEISEPSEPKEWLGRTSTMTAPETTEDSDVPLIEAATEKVPLHQLSSDAKKQIARDNSQRVYAGGLGWNRYQFHPQQGKILPESPVYPGTQWLHCRIEQDRDGLTIRELHLHLLEKQVLVYQNLLWFWQYPPNKQMFRTDIENITKTLPAEIMDFLLDLVSPGLFVQAADAHLSYSFSQALAPQPYTTPSQEAKPSEESKGLQVPKGTYPPGSSDASSPLAADKEILGRSPFAVRPVSSDLGETTLTRQAILEPLQTPPQPTYVTVLQEIQPTWLQRWLDRWFPHPPQFETVSVLRVGETQELAELGLTITFLIESTSNATFPWIRITRDSHLHRDATVTLLWNQEQKQTLPPNCKSTGALSRSTERGTLQIQFEQQGYQPLRLHIRWS